MMVERFATTQAAGGSVDLQRREFEGIACAFGRRSEGGGTPTIFRGPGVFRKTLQEGAKRVRILWQHQTHEILGKPLWLKETDAGLVFRARLDDIPRAHDALKLLKSGTLDSFSVGVDVLKWVDTADGRLVTEARLWEISLVTFAAVPGSHLFHCEGPAPHGRTSNTLTASLADKMAEIAGIQASITTDKYLDAISRQFRQE